MRLVPLSAVRHLPWARPRPELCDSTSCPVCRPLPEGYPGGSAMRWTPDYAALPENGSWRLPRG